LFDASAFPDQKTPGPEKMEGVPRKATTSPLHVTRSTGPAQKKLQVQLKKTLRISRKQWSPRAETPRRNSQAEGKGFYWAVFPIYVLVNDLRRNSQSRLNFDTSGCSWSVGVNRRYFASVLAHF
jgi:hypothetical protein